jgi:hypothetical protein
MEALGRHFKADGGGTRRTLEAAFRGELSYGEGNTGRPNSLYMPCHWMTRPKSLLIFFRRQIVAWSNSQTG